LFDKIICQAFSEEPLERVVVASSQAFCWLAQLVVV
jgi:hypothetical protein